MAKPRAPPPRKPLEELAYGFAQFRTLAAAVQLGVFDRLHGHGLSPRNFAEAFGFKERPARVFLTALHALGLVERKGPVVRNSALADAYLVSSSPLYYGDLLRRFDAESYENFRFLEHALRTDQPVVPVEGDVFRAIHRDPEATRAFYASMHGNAIVWARELAQRYDFSEHKVLLDVGGGTGTYAIEACRQHKGLRAIVFDLRPALDLARERIAEAGLTDRIELAPGDFFEDALPPGADVALLSAVLHDWPEEKIAAILVRVREALPPDGTVLVRELFVKDDRTGPLYAAMSSLIMLLEVHGENYTWSSYEGWLGAAGFGKFRRIPFPTTAAAGALVAKRQ